MSAEPSVDPTQVVREEWDAIADVYDVSYRWPVDIAEDALIAKWLRRITDHDGRILDLGCGTGALLDLCPVKPGRYVGVDLSPRMVELAQEKHPRHKFVVSPMEDFAAGLSGFASIVSLYGSLSYVHPAAWPRVCQRNSELGTRVHLMPLAQGRRKRTVHEVPVQEQVHYPDLDTVQGLFPACTIRGFGNPAIGERAGFREALWRTRAHAAIQGQLTPQSCCFLIVEGLL